MPLTLALVAKRLEANLSPMSLMAAELGPIKVTFSRSSSATKVVFSDRNPYPG